MYLKIFQRCNSELVRSQWKSFTLLPVVANRRAFAHFTAAGIRLIFDDANLEFKDICRAPKVKKAKWIKVCTKGFSVHFLYEYDQQHQNLAPQVIHCVEVIKSSRAAVAHKMQFSQYNLDTSSKYMEIKSTKVSDSMSEDQANNMPDLESSSKVVNQPLNYLSQSWRKNPGKCQVITLNYIRKRSPKLIIRRGLRMNQGIRLGQNLVVIMVKRRLILANSFRYWYILVDCGVIQIIRLNNRMLKVQGKLNQRIYILPEPFFLIIISSVRASERMARAWEDNIRSESIHTIMEKDVKVNIAVDPGLKSDLAFNGSGLKQQNFPVKVIPFNKQQIGVGI
ncbi:hypothetical protein MIR68_007206 [Amoeboaphelidium protococcarum]|nr:hypothetical protein MIR68_007206 [Amoeboaphelidium protococcarum]